MSMIAPMKSIMSASKDYCASHANHNCVLQEMQFIKFLVFVRDGSLSL